VGSAALGVRFALALMFSIAGLVKLRRQDEFAQAVANYRVLPRSLVKYAARWLPAAELTCGVLLGIGFIPHVVSVVLFLMVLAFTTAVVINLMRGRKIECGCLGLSVPKSISWGLVGRNAAIAVGAVFVAIAPIQQSIYPRTASMLSTGDVMGILVSSTAVVLSIAIIAETRRALDASGSIERKLALSL
jgi:uncharacterized membrane protein YphA (DoxX/SURF4 family)